jgi:outer membrane protein OmpA-like peptidoglycan-associated protein
MIYSTLLVDSSRHTAYGTFAHQEDFFISKKVNNEWSKGKPLGPPINTPGNEGALKLSTDGNTIVFTACNRPDGYGRCDIYFAHKTPAGWSNAINAGNQINTAYSEKQPCLSADGRILYFSSDRKDGLGEMDIWYSIKNKQGLWGKPINMGDTINTKYSEESPFIHPDNQTFYFSSDGHLGLGLKDIFYSRIDENNRWSKPVNIGYPINTYRDEIGLFIDNTGTTAYFSSDYNNSSRNIYQFTMPPKARPLAVSFMSGKVFDKINKLPLEANIELLNTTTGEKIMNVNSNKKSGNFLICLPIHNEYALNVSCKNYLFKSIHFNFNDSSYTYINPYKQDIALEKIRVNKTIILHNIFFAHNSYKLMPESTAELTKIKEFIDNNPNLYIEIGGHTDKTGDTDYNNKLSKERAKTVYDYLITMGVSSEKLTYKGYGESQPISQDDLSKNRRTELKIIKN